MKKSKTRYSPRRIKYSSVGSYIDTPTKAKLKVVYFIDDIGEYKLTLGNLPATLLKGCCFNILHSEVKRRKKFYKSLKELMDYSAGWPQLDRPGQHKIPFIFGLLKIRKGKKSKFIFIHSANHLYNSKLININAVTVDNLLYLDLINSLKEKP